MLARAASVGACLLLMAALPTAAQMAPTHRIEGRMEAASIAVGEAAAATLEATRVCPGDAVVLPEAEAKVTLDVPAGISATGPGTVTFPQQVCAQDPRATAAIRLRIEATGAAAPGLHRLGVTLRAPQLVGAPDEQATALAFTVVQPGGDGTGPAAPQGAGHAAPAPGIVAALGILALAALARRRAP